MDNGRPKSSAGASGQSKSSDHDAVKQGKEKNAGLTSTGHRKTLSGSISSFMFSRSSSNSDHGSETPSPTSPNGESASTSGAASSAFQPKSMRRRKGSLRKTALLVSGKSRMSEMKERQDSMTLEERKSLEGDGSDGSGTDPGTLSSPTSPTTPVDMTTPRPLPIPPPVPMDTHPIQGDPSKISASSQEHKPFQTLQRPGTAESTASTTDDEDTSAVSTYLVPPTKPLLAADSYFPLQPRVLPRPKPATPKTRSPLSTLPPSVPPSPPSEWDYSETRWWGWLILVVTWIVFVVGMGSCFEVWSWAWDVGETPYAPPELEDDPTLPIVGYYPALIILTTVMAWVWVTIAWVGMKYFKHANISGDEEPVT